jgi:glycosyltransferase involved in cell wall biosynthesis
MSELTIVIPAKNEEVLLPRLLASLKRQDYARMPETRILLADAGSIDNTVGVALEFSQDLDISVIKGGLPPVGRNNGAREAQSRYLLFIDADIELADPALIRRAVDLMHRKGLHCVTTDIRCREGKLPDRILYRLNNVAQRLSRFHKPFATGMFMLVSKKEFDRLGGFDEKALYAEDYQLTQRIDPKRFRVIPGAIYSTNRRFQKMGHGKIVRSFLATAMHHRNPEYFRSEMHQAYWEPY